MGAVVLLSAAVSAVTALGVLVVHALCVHGKADPACGCGEFLVPMDNADISTE